MIAAPAARSAPVLLGLFMISIILSVSVTIGGLRLTPTRIILVICFFPLLAQFLTGKLGRRTVGDWLLVFFCFWLIVSIIYTEGVSRIEFGIISTVELLGSFMLGRFLIRNAADFTAMVKWHIALLVIMAPFAVVEFVSGTQYWARILDVIGDVQYRQESSRPRYGFNRVLAGFAHPILYGIFCSMLVGTVFHIWRDNLLRVAIILGFVGAMTFMSLSSGAVLSVGFQIGLIVWGIVTKNRWLLLAGCVVGGVVFLELASNRGFVSIFISTFAFDGVSAWTRITQWEYGTAEVMRYPIFGKGLSSEWVRPSWLHTSSIDNYWLVVAFRHGLPAIAAQLAAIGFIVWTITKAGPLSEDSDKIRTGYLIVMVGVCFSLATVHIWDSNVIFFFFYLGAGLWLIDPAAGQPDTTQPDDDAAAPARARTIYTRFPPQSATPPPGAPPP